jgi:hypothetical protein
MHGYESIMPRVNLRTLWFEDIGLVNQPLIDTPFGRLTARQAVGIGFFALLAWLTFSALGFVGDLALRAVPAVLIFAAGAVVFSWRVKTVPPEKILILALGLGKKRGKPAKQKAAREKGAEKIAPKAPATVKVTKAQATVGEPFKVVGVLREPSLGTPLANRNFDVIVDGALRYKGTTDEQGGFEVVYIPENVGSVRIEVKPEGYAGVSQSIEVTVRGQAVGGARS